ncbi:carbohydrate ABC transporter permease [Sporosarcina sp. YIM B06819]|uniref:carbohydrate ABC transporter permease n=1 Tax=Sporosarcina sp. YIM B06819 TaxID=3081769 RepID=UPI00298C5010|nr:carbohydrate ABC transporter permease [Sporosarcina sp. YIM B06819]
MLLDTFSDKVFKFFNYTFLTMALVVVLYPVIFIVSASISSPDLVNSGEMWLLPKGITFEGYKMVFDNPQIWNGYKNTLIYTFLGTSINLLVTIPASYALSRKDFVGRGLITGLLLVTMFVSGGLIPSYLLIKSLGLIDTIWVMILPGAASVYNIIVCRTFFQGSIPGELEESAKIDGASNLTLFLKIILPLSAPIIAVMALFYGVGHWNSYFNALIYIRNQDLYPLQLVLRQILVLQEMSAEMTMDAATAEAMQNKATIADTVKYAVIIVATLPLIVIYPFMQRFFVKGVMIGSVKG